MKRVSFMIAVIIAMTCLAAMPAAAEGLAAGYRVMDYQTDRFELYGALSGTDAREASILVLNPGQSLSDADLEQPEALMGRVQYFKQVPLLGGAFTQEFQLREAEAAGEQPFEVRIHIGGQTAKFTFHYLTSAARNAGLAELNQLSAESETLGDVLDRTFRGYAMDWLTWYDGLEDKTAAGRYFAAIREAEGPFQEDEFQRVADTLLRAVVLEGFAENKEAELVQDGTLCYRREMGLEAHELAAELYSGGISQAGRDALNASMLGIAYTNLSEFQDRFERQCYYYGMLEPVTYGYGQIGEVLKDPRARDIFINAGFDASAYDGANQTKVHADVFQKHPADFDALVRALNSASNQYPKQDSGGGRPNGGGGGGGSGGGRAPGGAASDSPYPYTPPETPQTVQDAFSDLDAVEWARESINALYYLGVVNGKGDGLFAPEDQVTRDEFAKMLVGALGLQAEGAVCSFTDMPPEHWAYPYVASAFQNGIVKGRTETEFGSGENITNEEMIAMCARGAAAAGISLRAEQNLLPLADEADISEFALEAVRTMQQAGIVTGNENREFLPQSNAARAQAAKVIYGMLKLR